MYLIIPAINCGLLHRLIFFERVLQFFGPVCVILGFRMHMLKLLDHFFRLTYSGLLQVKNVIWLDLPAHINWLSWSSDFLSFLTHVLPWYLFHSIAVVGGLYVWEECLFQMWNLSGKLWKRSERLWKEPFQNWSENFRTAGSDLLWCHLFLLLPRGFEEGGWSFLSSRVLLVVLFK